MTMERPNAWKNYTKTDLKKVEEIAREYKAFIDAGKTERECAAWAAEAMEKAGYISLDKAAAGKKKLKAGDRIYLNIMNKAILTFLIGRKPLAEGMNIVGAHIDSPRLDIKQNPLYDFLQLHGDQVHGMGRACADDGIHRMLFQVVFQVSH